MFYDLKFFPHVQTNERFFMTIISKIVIGIFIGILFLLKIVFYDTNKKRFYSQIKLYKNETESVQLAQLANLLCKSTIMLFVNMFLTYIFIHVTGFYIIDTLKLKKLDNYLYEILEKLFIYTLVIAMSVVTSQFLILTFYKQFSPKTDYIRHFRNWELITVFITLVILGFMTFTQLYIKVDFNPENKMIKMANCKNKLLQIVMIYLFFLILEAGTRFGNTDKNVLFNTKLESNQKNSIHFYVQLILILYIIWNI